MQICNMNIYLKNMKTINFIPNQTKNEILRFLASQGNASAGKIAKECGISLPTSIKFIDELMKQNLVLDFGKHHQEGGRKPNIFGLNPKAGCFVGVEIRRHSVSLGVMNFTGELLCNDSMPFKCVDNQESVDDLCQLVSTSLKKNQIDCSKIVAYCFSIPGRVNMETGISYNYFLNEKEPLYMAIERRLGGRVYVDNDSRVMSYGEYKQRNDTTIKNMLYINISWGLGMGMIINGKLYYGTNGYAGEFGHVTFFDNEIFCRCGKKGCIETEASGSAMHRLLLAKHNAGARSILSDKIDNNEIIRTEDLVDATNQGDMLMIEIVEEIGNKLGKGVAGLINIFNPQLVVIGGIVANTKDYLLMSVKSAVRKYSLSIVNQETKIVLSEAVNADIMGGCFIARDKFLGILD